MTRLRAVRAWLSGFDQPPLDVVASAEHEALADELAARSVTLVRNDDGLIPLRLPADSRVAVLQPRPQNVTPADTTASATPLLAEHCAVTTRADRRLPRGALPYRFGNRRFGGPADRLRPDHPGHVRCAPGASAGRSLPIGSWSLASRPSPSHFARRGTWPPIPSARTYACSYGILPPSIEALGRRAVRRKGIRRPAAGRDRRALPARPRR